MKFTMKAVLTTALLAGSMAVAHAAPTWLGTVAKDYGSDAGKDKWAGYAGSCDTIQPNSVTITDTGSNCQRFWDTFNFSALNYESISYLELTLTYSDVGAGSCSTLPIFGTVCTGEYWTIRPASSGSVGTDANNAIADRLLATGGGSLTTTFLIDGSKYADVFSTIANNGVFHLWFTERTSGTDTFNLSSASLAVYGIAPEIGVVPTPGTLALTGLGLAALGWSSRRRRAAA